MMNISCWLFFLLITLVLIIILSLLIEIFSWRSFSPWLWLFILVTFDWLILFFVFLLFNNWWRYFLLLLYFFWLFVFVRFLNDSSFQTINLLALLFNRLRIFFFVIIYFLQFTSFTFRVLFQKLISSHSSSMSDHFGPFLRMINFKSFHFFVILLSSLIG